MRGGVRGRAAWQEQWRLVLGLSARCGVLLYGWATSDSQLRCGRAKGEAAHSRGDAGNAVHAAGVTLGFGCVALVWCQVASCGSPGTCTGVVVVVYIVLAVVLAV
jgi:hypothetical protein